MVRVVSVYLPTLPADRIRRADPSIPGETPLVIVARSGSKRWLSAVDANAAKLGLHVGMAAAKAQSLVQGLLMVDADPAADLAALERLTLWALSQYSPVVAVDPPDGIVMDTEGADHLQGGEELMLSGLVNRFRARGLPARAVVADTWGAAFGLARSMTAETRVVPLGKTADAVARLPLSSLRLSAEMIVSLCTLGFKTVGELAATPRAPLSLRFGPEIGRRLDQMFGRVAEPIDPIRSPEIIEVHCAFAEPIAAAETIAKYVSRLVIKLCRELQAGGLGVRRTDLIVHRVDNTIQALRAGTATPVRDVARLTKLLHDRIEKIDPGFGIEKLSLAATMVEPLDDKQIVSSLVAEATVDVGAFVDVLGNRGSYRIYRVAPVASDVPERSVKRISPVAADVGQTWPTVWPRPVRLMDRPELIEVMALLPDHPPVWFTWRGKRRRVKRADGPERIFGEWWRRTSEWAAVRDYFTVEDETGERYWIFRSGDGVDSDTGSHRWLLHGVFA
ncbi:DNA polymerase Y family protein [Rhizobium leguminosarum]|uniref:Y-family DNA polymerase n=1 Tax=Rhizobium leguminosarum TaxID=384 RepID=UPI001030E2CD|nr:DNA polymerase Y family protein [Rhizobium leguminosarum]TAV50195.1 DNA polymerase Y family protein [Rhizobium leguminosarum]TAV59558.1 DNA polymerase Y family protein [Rhizobium leguminosarum]TAV70605.1 DNA polymerase Y family protein [Rhizobium leguminosarum]TAY68220.1 DNA polymerase Y family protein [Rhizobium leguminosarum]